MFQIVVENLHKTFKVAKRQAGLWNSLRSIADREYKIVSALHGINFKLNAGELVGYIGPNGAGKSTTVKVMSGILVPDSGRCEILGLNPWKNRIQHVRHIGVVFGQRTQLWWDVPVDDSFDLIKDIYKIPVEQFIRTKNELTERLNLQSLLGVPVRQLSLGQKMRCELAASLLHQPPVLFLDEPTIGLDAISKIAIRDFIRNLNRKKGVTVILTTHDMDDIEALCSRIILIGKGKILLDGTIEQIRKQILPERVLKIDFLSKPSRVDIPGVVLLVEEDNHIALRFDPLKNNAMELIQVISAHNDIKDFIIENPPIEEIIAKMYREFSI